MQKTYNENEMVDLIKGLMCIGDNVLWRISTISGNFDIRFKGNRYNIQKKISEWLNVSERKESIQKRGGKI